MAGATCIPAAMAVRLMIAGKIAAPGVVTPEQVVPFEDLVELLEPLYVLPPGVDGPLVDVAIEAVETDG